ncbi:MAG: PcfJ domain-containing protein [Terriglobales bacterium]
MPTYQSTDTPTLTDLHDHELERHLAALGLRTVEEYVNWCARHGFSVRVEKHWHQRCKERYFALQQVLESRSARKKHESRHPRSTILEIARSELAASDLTQPYLISISAAFASLQGRVRDAFLQLLLHIQDCANLLLAGPMIRQLGMQAGNSFIDALASLAKHHDSWLRPVEQWKPRTHNSRRQFSSLANHLLAKYPVPGFMDSAWFLGNTPEAQRQQEWFKQIGSGKSPRQLDLPVTLTRRMVHHFLRGPADCTVEAALRWAQVLGLGGSARLAEAILGSRLATDFSHEEFWTSVIRWLIAVPMLDTGQIGPIVDYIHHQKFEPQQSAGAAEGSGSGPPQPDFSIQGRTAASILRQIREWHEDLRKAPQKTQLTWHECGTGQLDWTEGSDASGDLRHWTIQEILTRTDLFNEGRTMRHCVASYEHSCVSGLSAIWSMGLERNHGRRKRVLTVEVAIHRKAVCQVRGKANRLPTEKEMEILRRWAAREGLAVDDCVRAR